MLDNLGYNKNVRPYVLSLAGMDPSGGAGLLSDIKTFEAYNVYGLGVCTAITAQTEDTFCEVRWISENEILMQLEPLLDRYTITVIKIGIVENLERLLNIIRYIKRNRPNIYIVWDPIIKPSAEKNNFVFMKLEESLENNFSSDLLDVLKIIDCITPNKEEFLAWGHKKEWELISNDTALYIKSDFMDSNSIVDVLKYKGKVYTFLNPLVKFSKHGSGCVFSSALAASLSLRLYGDKENIWYDVCDNANKYIHKYLKSDKSLLGFHSTV